MKVFIDDIRTPEQVLGEDNAKGFIWIKEAWEAKNFLMKNSEEITEIHFDHYLGDDRITGGWLFEYIVAPEVIFDRRRGWSSLKLISLHSSDGDIVKGYLDEFMDDLQENGVTLVDNSQLY